MSQTYTIDGNPINVTAIVNNANIDSRYSFNPYLAGLTGGGTSNLDGISTALIPTGFLMQFVISGSGLTAYQLQSGTAATSSPGVIRPLDFDASTNARIWVQEQ